MKSNQPSNNPSWLRRIGAALLAAVAALLLGTSAASAAQTSISDKNPGANTTYLWSAAGTWDSGGIPVSANDLTIVMIARTFRAGWTDDISLTNNTLIIGGSAKDFWGGSGNPTLAFQGVSPALINTNAQGYSFFGVNVKLDVDTLFTSTIGAGATCDLNTSVSGVAALIASNGVAGGNLRLLQNNSFSGGLKLLAGRLILQNAGGLGATASTLTIENGTQLESGTANLVLNKANPIKINGDFAFGSTLSLDMGLGAVTLGTTAGTTRTITVTNAGVVFTLSGNVANGTTANSITKAGPGTLTLSGTNTYTGATLVNAGTLNINSLSTGGGSFTTADGTTLGVVAGNAVASMPISSLTLGAAAATTLNFNLGAVNPTVAVAADSGALTLNGPVTVNVTGTALTGPGPIVLLSYGSLSGAGSFVTGTLPVIPNYTPSLVNDTVNKQLKLVLASTPAVKWAVGNGNWDTTTANWQPIAGGAATTYIDPAYVLFDDTASGASPITVNLPAGRTPGSITNNSTKNYTFTSSGLSGAANLIKLGTSTLTLANANTYTGGTTISAGTLQLGDGTTVNGSVSGNITDNAILTVANPSAQTIASVISGTGALTKTGAGTLSLINTNTYLGGTLISAGTLQLGDGVTANGALVGNGTNNFGNITNNATLAVANPTTQIISNNISGTGALVKSGAGTLTLSGTNGYSGATTVNDGTLKVSTTNATGAGSYTVAAGKTLDITYASGSPLRISSLTLAASTLSFNLGTGNPATAVVSNTGALTLSGTVTVNVTGTSLTSGSIILIAYGSGGSGTFVAGTLPAVAGNSVILVNDTVNKQLKLVAAPLQTMVWNVADGDWDLTTANWTNITSANLLTTYLDNSPVRLDDTGAGNPIAINLPVERAPGNIISTNSTIIYSVSGSAITGPASFTKAGTALTLLGSSNSYSGGTLVKDGILSIATGSALGNPSGSVVATVTNTGSLNLRQSRLDSTGKFVVISGSGADSTHGALYAEPGASYFVSGAPFVGVQNLRLAGDATIGGPGAFNAGVFAIGISEKGQADGSNNIVGNLDGKNFSLTKIGGSQLVLFNTNSSALSQLVVAEGSVMFERTASGNPIGATTPIVISNNAYIDTWDLSQPTLPPGVTFSNNITIGAGGGKLRNGVGSYYVSADQDNYRGTVTLNGALTVETISTFSGAGSGGLDTRGKITITGAILGTNAANGVNVVGPAAQYVGINHTIVFSGTNNYNGPTVLNNFVTLQTTTDNQGGGDYTVNDNSVLDVLPVVGKPYLPTANLTIGNAALNFSRLTSLPTNPVIYATNLIVNGGSTVILPQSIYALGTYPLIKYEGTILGNGIGGLALSGLPRGVTASLVDNTANHTVDLVVTDASGVLWTGNLSTDWDTGITANWLYLASPVTFANGDYVGFNDTATSFVAILTNNVSPANITVNTSTNYGFGGAAYSIIGAATLVKTGSGTLTISNANNGYTDGTFLNAGEIDLGNATPLGTGLVTVNGGTLASIGGIRTLPNNLVIAGNFQAGGQGQNLVLNGNVDLGGATRTITLGNFLTLGGQIANGGVTATTAGGYRELVLSASNTYAGGTIASGGAALRVNNATGSGTGSGSVTINSGATLWGSGTIAGPVSFNAGSHFIGSTFQVLTLTNSLTIATSGTIPDVALSLSNNVPVGSYTLATYNTNGSSGVFNSTPSISGGSLAPSTAATIITSNGAVVLKVVAVSTTPPSFPPGGVSVLPGGGISLVSTGAIGGTYRLWATTNLALTPVTNTWTLINSGTITTSPFTNVDLTATNYTKRFYLFSTP